MATHRRGKAVEECTFLAKTITSVSTLSNTNGATLLAYLSSWNDESVIRSIRNVAALMFVIIFYRILSSLSLKIKRK